MIESWSNVYQPIYVEAWIYRLLSALQHTGSPPFAPTRRHLAPFPSWRLIPSRTFSPPVTKAKSSPTQSNASCSFSVDAILVNELEVDIEILTIVLVLRYYRKQIPVKPPHQVNPRRYPQPLSAGRALTGFPNSLYIATVIQHVVLAKDKQT
jgi:hypothetical protein